MIKNFIKRYNSQYNNLLPEQKELLSKYIGSLNEGIIDFQVYLVEELKRIKGSVADSLQTEEVKSDESMVSSTKHVLEKIDNFNVINIGEKEVLKILKMQNLVNEYNENADQN